MVEERRHKLTPDDMAEITECLIFYMNTEQAIEEMMTFYEKHPEEASTIPDTMEVVQNDMKEKFVHIERLKLMASRIGNGL